MRKTNRNRLEILDCYRTLLYIINSHCSTLVDFLCKSIVVKVQTTFNKKTLFNNKLYRWGSGEGMTGVLCIGTTWPSTALPRFQNLKTDILCCFRSAVSADINFSLFIPGCSISAVVCSSTGDWIFSFELLNGTRPRPEDSILSSQIETISKTKLQNYELSGHQHDTNKFIIFKTLDSTPGIANVQGLCVRVMQVWGWPHRNVQIDGTTLKCN